VARRLPHRVRHVAGGHFDDLQLPAELGGVEDPLVRLTVHGRERGSQRLVPPDQVPQGGVECRRVEATGQPGDQRQVVVGVQSFELGEEPESALGER
jgi:hypothetical protein